MYHTRPRYLVDFKIAVLCLWSGDGGEGLFFTLPLLSSLFGWNKSYTYTVVGRVQVHIPVYRRYTTFIYLLATCTHVMYGTVQFLYL